MARIDYIIPAQYYELIRDRIGAILALELNNQVLLSGDYDLDADVFVESGSTFDKIEIPVINVSLVSVNYDNKEQGSVRGTYVYAVDAFTSAKSGNTVSGDVRATFKLHRLLGVCRAILENPVYKTLDFTPPSISRTLCSDIQIAKTTKDDATNTAMGRVNFTVVANETTELLTALQISEYYTKVKLHETDKGYQYEITE